MPIDKAIEAMKIHHQWLPDMIFYEPDKMSPDTREALKAMGHSLSYRRLLRGSVLTLAPEIDRNLEACEHIQHSRRFPVQRRDLWGLCRTPYRLF